LHFIFPQRVLPSLFLPMSNGQPPLYCCLSGSLVAAFPLPPFPHPLFQLLTGEVSTVAASRWHCMVLSSRCLFTQTSPTPTLFEVLFFSSFSPFSPCSLHFLFSPMLTTLLFFSESRPVLLVRLTKRPCGTIPPPFPKATPFLSFPNPLQPGF